MEGKPKLYYFDLYGKGECIRMALHHAKIDYEDIRVTFESWGELKASGKFPFGQLPMLELADGTVMTQSVAIMNYLGAKHNIRPQDPLACYQGEKACEYLWNDFWSKKNVGAVLLFAGPDGREEKMKTLTEDIIIAFDQMAKNCVQGKFVAGDELSIYDF